MNLKRLLDIAQEADKNGDYVTADKVTNLLKTAQGQYSVYPSQPAQANTNAGSSDQQYNTLKNQYLSHVINNTHAWNSAFVKLNSVTYGTPEYNQIHQTLATITDKNRNLFEAIKQDNRLTEQQKEQINAEGRNAMNSVMAEYESGQIKQTPDLQISGGAGYAPVPYKNELGQYPGMSNMPQMNQQMPQQGGVYNPGIAPGATIYTPGVVNVAQPQMTDEQKAFAKLRGLRGQVQQADQVVQQNAQRPRQYPIYQAYQQPVYQGTNTQAQYNFNPNAPINPSLYGTGYASMAMQPQMQPPYNPQQPQQQ
jgi:hypothetical protein